MAKKLTKGRRKKGDSSRTRGRSVSSAPPNALPPAIRVRMFRQGLGDCFLITFGAGGRSEQHMLIDFGTLGSSAPEEKKITMRKVIESIKKSTGGKLAILVATHAHQDHVNGFLSQKPVLETFEIQHVWMPWTENPKDALAKELGNTARAMRATIAKSLTVAQSLGSKVLENVASLAGFEGLGLEALDDQADGPAMGDSIARALDVVRDFPGAKTTYHSPGPPAVKIAEIPGFVFYVLGPPRDATKLQNMDKNAADELYGLNSAIDAHTAPGFEWALDDETPFDRRFCYPTAQADQFFPDYKLTEESYRRIDDQWLRGVAELAVKLDNFRNNTSLALAIERVADGKVLLFPADAQEGNWLSWHDPPMRWKLDGGEDITATDLLKRTVFYKVGHHASHNATPKRAGLELMGKKTDLTAFIPVDRAIALKRSPPGSWRMPAVELFRALLNACDGRVARADIGWATQVRGLKKKDVEFAFTELDSTENWARWTASQNAARNVTFNDLFIEYLLP